MPGYPENCSRLSQKGLQGPQWSHRGTRVSSEAALTGPQARGPTGAAAPALAEETGLPEGPQGQRGRTQQEQERRRGGGMAGPVRPRSREPGCLRRGGRAQQDLAQVSNIPPAQG